MKFVTVDFETYYDREYSLTKMSTEDYVNDPRFEVILVGVKINNDTPYWISGTKARIAEHLHSLELHKCAVLAHNMLFDGLILAVQYDIYPKMYLDSLAMAQAALKPYTRSISLDSCLKHLELGIHKGTEVHNMIGRTRQSLSKQELANYGAYCVTDCEGEFRLFKYLVPQFPKAELEIIDMTLRMYLQPQLTLNGNLCAELLQEVRAKKAQSLASLPADVQSPDLMSNAKFADALQRYGVDVPTKISPTTGAVTYAFAKTDTAWKELEEEWADDPVVSAILAARISAKSTLEETRLQRLLDISLKRDWFRLPLRYYAAHTGRYGGMESINVQNFPRADKSRMRGVVQAPKGHVVLAADLAQIEARITAWLAGQKDLLQAFRDKKDAYSLTATNVLRVETIKGRSKEDDLRRFLGKTMTLGLTYGTGAAKLRATLRKDGYKAELTECEQWVNGFRQAYFKIPALWRRFDGAIEIMAANARTTVGPLTFAKNIVQLPNGMCLVYNRLRQVQSDKYSGWVYDFAGETRKLWGGIITENAVQALARIVVMEHMLAIKHTLGLNAKGQVHDELIYVVPEQYAEKTALALAKMMRKSPSWAPDLPLEVEVHFGQTYLDCK